MYQFTTPSLIIKIPTTVPVNTMTALVVTLQQDALVMEKTLDDVQLDNTHNTIGIVLSQEETGAFGVGMVKVQCHILVGTDAYATNIMTVCVGKNLHGEVISA